jgi:hypothetical protein
LRTACIVSSTADSPIGWRRATRHLRDGAIATLTL